MDKPILIDFLKVSVSQIPMQFITHLTNPVT